MINKEFSFENVECKRVVPERMLPFSSISYINAVRGRHDSGYIWALQHESNDAKGDIKYSLPFVTYPPHGPSLHRGKQHDLRRIAIRHKGSLVGLRNAIFLYKGDEDDMPPGLSETDGSWVDPTVFYHRDRSDGVSSHIIEDLFQSGMFTEVAPFYKPRERNSHIVFPARESSMD